MATETTIKTRLLSAYKTASTWTSLNPVLKKGEIGFESDTGLYKVGDGSTAWSSLSYAVDSALSSTSSKPLSNKAINTALNNKVDKVSGKGLSTNDYTTDEKTKLSGIDAGANKTTVDTALSSSSTNPVQNKAINTALSGKLGTSGDSKDNTTTFTSGDAADGSVSRTTGWSTVAALATGEKHSSLFNKVSTMMKNVRYLYKLLGTTNISSLSTDGTVTGALSKLNTELIGTGAHWHNSVYRGKNLGTSISTAQNTAIKNGTFDDMFIGDYWVINGHTWRIAAFNYYYRCGDTDFTKPNIIVVPDSQLYSFQMAYTASGGYEAGSVNTTEGGYTNSYGFKTGLTQARTIAKTDFGNHVAAHRIICTNATSNGKPSGWAWRDSDGVELMNEQQIYGSGVWDSREQNGWDVGSQKTQFPLFTLAPQWLNTRQSYWLQDVRSATFFARVTCYGDAHYYYASAAYGCRPAVTLTYT